MRPAAALATLLLAASPALAKALHGADAPRPSGARGPTGWAPGRVPAREGLVLLGGDLDAEDARIASDLDG